MRYSCLCCAIAAVFVVVSFSSVLLAENRGSTVVIRLASYEEASDRVEIGAVPVSEPQSAPVSLEGSAENRASEQSQQHTQPVPPASPNRNGSAARFVVPALAAPHPGDHGPSPRQSAVAHIAPPPRTPIQPNPQPLVRQQAKPFESYQPEQTISPYLNLYRDEDAVESIPNYFAFVRPQQEQQEANRSQQREIQQLRGQLQNISSAAATRVYSKGAPGTGTRARYMDTAQFYSGLQR